jgi:hypothetical protein
LAGAAIRDEAGVYGYGLKGPTEARCQQWLREKTQLGRASGCCTNVKVKRLFLWLAEKNKGPWLKK